MSGEANFFDNWDQQMDEGKNSEGTPMRIGDEYTLVRDDGTAVDITEEEYQQRVDAIKRRFPDAPNRSTTNDITLEIDEDGNLIDPEE